MLLKVIFSALFISLLLPGAQAQIAPSDTTRQEEIKNDSLSFLPPGTIIHVRRDNKIYCFLPENIKIQGVVCRGHLKDWETGFYANGKLALAWLPYDQVIQGVPCMKASFWTEAFGKSAKVLFHENGQLARCRLAGDCILQGQAFKRGDVVRFDEHGKLIKSK